MSTSDNPAWRRSSRCASGNCVEVARAEADYLIRDSTSPAAEPLRIPAAAWHAFLAGIRSGEFE